MNPKDRIANNLVALGSAAVFTVYAAGYLRTRSAAQRFAVETERRPVAPAAAIPLAPSALPEPTANVVPAHPAPTSPAPTKERSLPRGVESTTIASAVKPKPASTFAPHPATDHTPTADSTTSAAAAAPAPAPIPVTVATVPAVVATPRDSSGTTAANKTADSTAKAEKERAPYKDGVYFGWGTSRHGDIQAGVEIKGGRIASAFISECLTQYSCSWISLLPAQVVARQSPEVDFVSGATQSANAFYYAVVDALKKAK